MIRDRRFLRYYEQELRFVRDLAGEFASEHARVANRFGLDADACADPHVEWLLDGTAFLAARVQQKLDSDYAVFTSAMLDMVYPDYLCPTPSTGIVALALAPDAPALEDGFTVPRGTRLLSRVVPGESTRCTFTTAQDVTVWPIELAEARYLGQTTLAGQNVPRPRQARAALLLRLRTRGGVPFSSLSLDRLDLHLASRDRTAHLVFEALVGHAVALVGRAAGKLDGAVALGGAERIARRGFADQEALFPPSPRGFSGYRLLREYFTLPERFLFVALTGLRPIVRRTVGSELELIVLLDRFEPALDGAVTSDVFALHATPAINLVPRRAKPILLEAFEREHHVVGDRLRPLDYEIYALREVTGYGPDEREAMRFRPFYAVEAEGRQGATGYYGIERRQRLLGEREERSGAARSVYLGSELFIALCNAEGGPLSIDLKRLDIEALCTNRDLPIRLPLPPGELHFTVETGGPVAGARAVGPLTRPKPSLATVEPAENVAWGETAWRLVGHLSLTYHSLVEGPDERGADALRSLLELYAGAAEPQVARHAEAVRGIAATTVTRRLPGGGPIAFGRGLELVLELVEGQFQDGSAFLLGSVMEEFFRRYVGINSFTETVLRTSERGEIMRWPARIGSRHLM